MKKFNLNKIKFIVCSLIAILSIGVVATLGVNNLTPKANAASTATQHSIILNCGANGTILEVVNETVPEGEFYYNSESKEVLINIPIAVTASRTFRVVVSPSENYLAEAISDNGFVVVNKSGNTFTITITGTLTPIDANISINFVPIHAITLSCGANGSIDSVNNVSGTNFSYNTNIVTIAPTSSATTAQFSVTVDPNALHGVVIETLPASISCVRNGNVLTFTISGQTRVAEEISLEFSPVHSFEIVAENCSILNCTSSVDGFYYNSTTGTVEFLVNESTALEFEFTVDADDYYEILDSSYAINDATSITNARNENRFTISVAINVESSLNRTITITASAITYNATVGVRVDGGEVINSELEDYVGVASLTTNITCNSALTHFPVNVIVCLYINVDQDLDVVTQYRILHQIVLLDKNGDVYGVLASPGESYGSSAIYTPNDYIITSEVLDNCLYANNTLKVVAIYRSAVCVEINDVDGYSLEISSSGWQFTDESSIYYESGSMISLEYTRETVSKQLISLNYTITDSSANTAQQSTTTTLDTDGNYSTQIPLLNSYADIIVSGRIKNVEYTVVLTCYNESTSLDFEEDTYMEMDGSVGTIFEYKVCVGDTIADVYVGDESSQLEGYRFVGWYINGELYSNDETLTNISDYYVDLEDVSSGIMEIKAHYIQVIGVEIKIPSDFRNTSVNYVLYRVTGSGASIVETIVPKNANNRYEFDYGTKVKLQATSSEYIEFVNCTINNDDVVTTSTLNTTLVEDTQYLLNFKNVEINYTVAKNVDAANGTLEISSETVSIGKSLIIAFNSKAGYAVDNWEINGKSVEEFVSLINSTYGDIANYSAEGNTITIKANEGFIEYLKQNGFNTSVSTAISSTILIVVVGAAILIVACLLLSVILIIMNAKKKKQVAAEANVAQSQVKRMDMGYLDRLREGKE